MSSTGISGRLTQRGLTTCWAMWHTVLVHAKQESSFNQTLIKWAIFFSFFFNVYLFLRGRKRQSVSRGGADRGDTESKAGSRLWAVSTEPDTGLELTNCNIMTWAKAGRLTNWAAQVPQMGKISLTQWSRNHLDQKIYKRMAKRKMFEINENNLVSLLSISKKKEWTLP